MQIIETTTAAFTCLRSHNSARWNPLESSEEAFMESPSPGVEILIVPEVAALLRVVDKTVYTMAQRSELPAFKVRGQWRFKRNDIENWIQQQKANRQKNVTADE